jgi:hypothetical protein
MWLTYPKKWPKIKTAVFSYADDCKAIGGRRPSHQKDLEQ